MESSIVESSINMQEVFANAMINDFLGSILHTLFLSPFSIFVYGGIAILILRVIFAKIRNKKK